MIQFRSHFGLRSALFSVQARKGEVRILGHGYGHGVGLCQEGAMQMASKGWTYDKIINYYYRGVKIVNITEVAPAAPIIDGDIEKIDTIKGDTTKTKL